MEELENLILAITQFYIIFPSVVYYLINHYILNIVISDFHSLLLKKKLLKKNSVYL